MYDPHRFDFVVDGEFDFLRREEKWGWRGERPS